MGPKNSTIRGLPVLKSNYFSDPLIIDSNKPIFPNWMSGDEDDVFNVFRLANSVHK